MKFFIYIDSNTESESDDSDDTTIKGTSADNSRQLGYTHRIHQRKC